MKGAIFAIEAVVPTSNGFSFQQGSEIAAANGGFPGNGNASRGADRGEPVEVGGGFADDHSWLDDPGPANGGRHHDQGVIHVGTLSSRHIRISHFRQRLLLPLCQIPL